MHYQSLYTLFLLLALGCPLSHAVPVGGVTSDTPDSSDTSPSSSLSFDPVSWVGMPVDPNNPETLKAFGKWCYAGMKYFRGLRTQLHRARQGDNADEIDLWAKLTYGALLDSQVGFPPVASAFSASELHHPLWAERSLTSKYMAKYTTRKLEHNLRELFKDEDSSFNTSFGDQVDDIGMFKKWAEEGGSRLQKLMDLLNEVATDFNLADSLAVYIDNFASQIYKGMPKYQSTSPCTRIQYGDVSVKLAKKLIEARLCVVEMHIKQITRQSDRSRHNEAVVSDLNESRKDSFHTKRQLKDILKAVATLESKFTQSDEPPEQLFISLDEHYQNSIKMDSKCLFQQATQANPEDLPTDDTSTWGPRYDDESFTSSWVENGYDYPSMMVSQSNIPGLNEDTSKSYLESRDPSSRHFSDSNIPPNAGGGTGGLAESSPPGHTASWLPWGDCFKG
ncbi:hypothetical protein SeLEV6574_g02034 [Synchytrium endobioticum]|uniref:Uncharacterized protein n=1 Tax=Synchytrium endobioticum TaxID=286115 RepID=A0A507D9Y2_9FUNG|nr:hypothetical protein SeLEV6574_g02034 [Synchytrium endobioticum]